MSIDLSQYDKEIAKIVGTELGLEDRGILTAVLRMDYGDNSFQGVGGYNLARTAGQYLRRTLSACGVDHWEKIKGRTVFVLFERGGKGLHRRPLGIAPLPTEPGIPFLFDEMKDEDE